MSIKMYNYRVSKDQWWPLAQRVREFYLSDHPIPKALSKSTETSFTKYSETVDELVKEWSVELQLFDEGDTFLIRPLEAGWYFGNNSAQWEEFGVEEVFYDNRSDVPPEHEKNRAVADWVDEQIDKRRYLIFYVLNREAFMDIYFDRMFKE